MKLYRFMYIKGSEIRFFVKFYSFYYLWFEIESKNDFDLVKKFSFRENIFFNVKN